MFQQNVLCWVKIIAVLTTSPFFVDLVVMKAVCMLIVSLKPCSLKHFRAKLTLHEVNSLTVVSVVFSYFEAVVRMTDQLLL
jgi:hypothetical protein